MGWQKLFKHFEVWKRRNLYCGMPSMADIMNKLQVSGCGIRNNPTGQSYTGNNFTLCLPSFEFLTREMLNRLCKTIVRKLRGIRIKKEEEKFTTLDCCVLLRNLGEIERIENKSVRVHLGIFLMDIALERMIVWQFSRLFSIMDLRFGFWEWLSEDFQWIWEFYRVIK